MAQAKPVASLKPALLARKGGARPSLRAQQQPDLAQGGEAGDPVRESAATRSRGQAGAKVVALNTIRIAAPAGKGQALRRQREHLADRIAGTAKAKPAVAVAVAPARVRPRAFTLRLDAERHLKLRLASALAGRSAQQLVVEALDSMLAALPEVAQVAARSGKRP